MHKKLLVFVFIFNCCQAADQAGAKAEAASEIEKKVDKSLEQTTFNVSHKRCMDKDVRKMVEALSYPLELDNLLKNMEEASKQQIISGLYQGRDENFCLLAYAMIKLTSYQSETIHELFNLDHHESLKCLLRHKADPNGKNVNKDGTAWPLILGVENLRTIQFLVEHKADINAPLADGATMLMESSEKQNIKKTELLLSLKADPGAKDAGGLDWRDYAFKSAKKYEAAVQALLEKNNS